MIVFPEAAQKHIGKDTTTGVFFVSGSEDHWDGRQFKLVSNGWGTNIHLVGNGYDRCIARYQSFEMAEIAYDMASSSNTLDKALALLERMSTKFVVSPDDWVVYILHFSQRVGEPRTPIERHLLGKTPLPPRQGQYKSHAGHYVGVTNNLDRRMKEHKSGNGKSSPLVKALVDGGGSFQVAHLYNYREHEKSAHLEEKRIKAQKNTPKLCVVCKESK